MKIKETPDIIKDQKVGLVIKYHESSASEIQQGQHKLIKASAARFASLQVI